MNRKFIYSMAAFAVVLGVSSCSTADDDLLATAQPQGKPLTVRVNGETLTRGEYASAITGFKMTGLANGNYGTEWFKDGAFTKSGSWTNDLDADKKSWPSTTAKYDFFAASEDGTAASVSTSTLTDGKITFDYTVPTDLASQKDLLVATNIGATSTDNDGEVSLNFQHALSSVKILGRLASSDYNNGTWGKSTGLNYDIVLYIDAVSIYGIKTKGTFTYGSTTSTSVKGSIDAGSWSSLSNPTSASLLLQKTFDTPLEIISLNGSALTKADDVASYPHFDLLGGTSDSPATLMVLPQTLNSWDGTNTPATDGTQLYLAIHAKAYDYYTKEQALTELEDVESDLEDDPDDSDLLAEKTRLETLIANNGGAGDQTKLAEGTYYIPIYVSDPENPSTKNFKFEANKTHTLRIRLNNLRKANGTAAIAGASLSM